MQTGQTNYEAVTWGMRVQQARKMAQNLKYNYTNKPNEKEKRKEYYTVGCQNVWSSCDSASVSTTSTVWVVNVVHCTCVLQVLLSPAYILGAEEAKQIHLLYLY